MPNIKLLSRFLKEAFKVCHLQIIPDKVLLIILNDHVGFLNAVTLCKCSNYEQMKELLLEGGSRSRTVSVGSGGSGWSDSLGSLLDYFSSFLPFGVSACGPPGWSSWRSARFLPVWLVSPEEGCDVPLRPTDVLMRSALPSVGGALTAAPR